VIFSDPPTLHDMVPDKPSQWSLVARAAGKARCKATAFRARERNIAPILLVTVEASGLRGASIYTKAADFLDQQARALYAANR